jgi:hypothetical protein
LAALFVSLDAFFIGVIQILVYAGAVMVLFLFIIMLLDLKAERRRKFNMSALCGGPIVLILFLIVLSRVCYSFGNGNARFPALAPDPQGDAWHIGWYDFVHAIQSAAAGGWCFDSCRFDWRRNPQQTGAQVNAWLR